MIRMTPAQVSRNGRGRTGLLGIVLIAVLVAAVVGVGPSHRSAQAAAAITGLHVQGNQVLNGSNQPVRLLGVDRSGTEYACIQGWGIFDGPSDAASVQAIASWNTNAVRVPLNEDCWLNINMGSSVYGGSTYQQAIVNYVNLLNSYGLVAILDLHWNAPGTTQATGQQPMPDEDHAPAFWQSVATTFLGSSSVIFDLYNEPYPDSNQDTTAGWQCWRDGGTCPGVSFQAAGMQQLVTTIRSTGSTNIIMLGGLEYANALSQWLTYEPSDPQHNLAASWHSYNFNICNTQSCWDSTVAPVAQQVPLIAGEIGENDCAHGYIDPLMNWMDSHNASYLGWTWDTWNCSSGPALISDYSGTPTNFGVGLQQHLAALASASPTPTATPGTPSPTPTVTPTSTSTPTATPAPTNTPLPADFSLSASPTSQSVPSSGGTRTYTVTITPSNGFAGQVTLSATGQPSTSTVGFSPNPATSSSTMTVTTVSGTPKGIYTITIHGTSGALSHTTSVTLTVTKH